MYSGPSARVLAEIIGDAVAVGLAAAAVMRLGNRCNAAVAGSFSSRSRRVMRHSTLGLILMAGLTAGCAATANPPAAAAAIDRLILVRSTPAAGSTVSAPVNALELRFDPP